MLRLTSRRVRAAIRPLHGGPYHRSLPRHSLVPRRPSGALTVSVLLASAVVVFGFPGYSQQPTSPETTADKSVSDKRTRAALTSDVEKAEAITFAEANLRINFKNDTELAYALLHVRNAQSAADVQNAFKSAKDNIDEVLDRDMMVALFKGGAKFFGNAAAGYVIDGANWLAKQADENDGKLRFDTIPETYASTILLGGIDNASPDVKLAIAQEIAEHMGRKFDDTVDAVTQNRILEDPKDKEPKGPFIDRELYDDQIKSISDGLNNVKQALDRQVAGQQTEPQKETASGSLAHETERLKAGVYLTGLILGPIVGRDAANKITTVGNNLVQMNLAVKQFGPNGLTPDKLLMFSNFATAGFAIVGMLTAPQEDPTMVALKDIMKQLDEIKRQLQTIEGKIDDLSDLVLVGFERTLIAISQLQIEFAAFEQAILGHNWDESQRKAIDVFLKYISGDPQHYSLTQQCDEFELVKKVDDMYCLNEFARLLSDRTLYTQNLDVPRVPDIVSTAWSNQILTPRYISPGGDYKLVLEQLSYPIYFANDPQVFRSMIAYNQSAAAAYSTGILGTPRPYNLANPEILANALRALVATFKIRPSLQGDNAGQLLEQALKRVTAIEDLLGVTVGDERTMGRLWEAMENDLKGYEDKVNGILPDLTGSPYTEQKIRFNGGNLGTIAPCSTTPGWPQLQAPLDPATGQRMDKYVDPIYWAAEEMRLGRVVQCYEITHGPPFFTYNAQVIATVRLFFNRAPATDPTTISAWELSPAGTSFSPSSLPIATMTYTTNRHYSTLFGNALGVYTRAWGSPPANVHDVFECKVSNPFIQYDPACKAGPDGDSPVQALVTKSTNVGAAAGANTKLAIQGLVHAVLGTVVQNRSELWDAEHLDFVPGSMPNVLQGREVMTKPVLANALEPYTLKYLLAKNLFMMSFYHQNRVAGCLRMLDNYSPQAVINLAADRMMQQRASIYDEFFSVMKKVNDQCLGHSIHPELAELKSEIRNLMTERNSRTERLLMPDHRHASR